MTHDQILDEIREIEQLAAALAYALTYPHIITTHMDAQGIQEKLQSLRKRLESTNRRHTDRRTRPRTKKPDRRTKVIAHQHTCPAGIVDTKNCAACRTFYGKA